MTNETATIYEQGNGLADVGDYVAGNDGEVYVVVELLHGGRIETHGPGCGNSVDAVVALADWSDVNDDNEPVCGAVLHGDPDIGLAHYMCECDECS